MNDEVNNTNEARAPVLTDKNTVKTDISLSRKIWYGLLIILYRLLIILYRLLIISLLVLLAGALLKVALVLALRFFFYYVDGKLKAASKAYLEARLKDNKRKAPLDWAMAIGAFAMGVTQSNLRSNPL